MKKLSIALALCVISATTFANWLDGRGICQEKAYFFGHFVENQHFQFRLYGPDTSIVLEFDTRDNFTIDSLISIPISAGITDVKVQFRNRYNDGSPYNKWAGNYNVDPYYEMIDTTNSACFTMPVQTSSVTARKVTDGISVSFKPGDESGVNHYNILASTDAVFFVKVGELQATGQKNYSIKIPPSGVLVLFVPLIALIKGQTSKNNRRKWLSFFIFFAMLFFISCNKDNIKRATGKNYIKVRIESISNTGASSLTEIVTVR